MNRLFYGEITPNAAVIPEEEMHHIRQVLRIKDGAEEYVTNGKGDIAKVRLEFIGKKTIAHVIERNFVEKSFSPNLHLVFVPTKNLDRTEFFLEKSTELDVSKITFLFTQNSERKIINIEKLQKRSIAASKQSLNPYFVEISECKSLVEFSNLYSNGIIGMAHCAESDKKIPISDFISKEKHAEKEIIILIGPEGDFSHEEIELAREKNWEEITFGERRLRTDTAGIFAAAIFYQKISLL